MIFFATKWKRNTEKDRGNVVEEQWEARLFVNTYACIRRNVICIDFRVDFVPRKKAAKMDEKEVIIRNCRSQTKDRGGW